MNSEPFGRTSEDPVSVIRTATPWEQGSEFHLVECPPKVERIDSPWDRDGLFFGSGSDALRAILMSGMISRGWKRLRVPSYFCPTVVHALIRTGISVCPYKSWYPGDEEGKRELEVSDGDVVLIVNHFGLEPEIHIEAENGGTVLIIEDHTHDPWSSWAYNSRADYCIASLRKTLPIPDGGVLWSPTNQALPGTPLLTEEHRRAAGEKLRAMELKDSFLRGQVSDKSEFRALSASGEKNLCGSEVSAILGWTAAHLGGFPMMEWRKTRKRNFEAFAEVFSSEPRAKLLFPSSSIDCVPFSCVILFDSAERRDFVRFRLIEANIYPAILWPLERPAISDGFQESIAASRRMLSVHCDMRYTVADMRRVADAMARLSTLDAGPEV